MFSTYLMLAPLTNIELSNVVGNSHVSHKTRTVARLMLQVRLAYAAGDYYSAAEHIAAIRKVA